MTYDDPRLAALYDIDNPDGPDHDFFRAVVEGADAEHVIDLGCGTGILTVTLAAPCRHVVGIDPAAAMLEHAAARLGGDGVEWRLGTSELIEPASTDVVIMSGNVAMHIIGDDWRRTLCDITRGLRPGGRLAFETRNPDARAWEEWSHPSAERDTPAGRLRETTTIDALDRDGIVTMHCVTEFLDDGRVLEVDQHLQFRDLAMIRRDLSAAGLRVESVWGDWSRTPFRGTADERLLVVEAVRGATS